MRLRITTLALSVVLAATSAFAASPSLSIILPRGIQRGAEHQVTFTGGRLTDAAEIFFYDKGFEVTKLEVKDDANVVATVKVAPDCRLGEHSAQVRTKSGISEFKTFFVGALPAIDEVEPNTDFEAPQAIDFNVTVQGVVTNEDVDYFVVQAKKGQRISVEIEAMRLDDTMFDPYVAILDAKRFELSSSDDAVIVKQDAAGSIVAPEDGPYIIEVREAAYGGDGNCRYRLHVGNFPRPTAVYPAGGKMGEELEVTFLGDAAGPLKQKVTPATEPNENYEILAEQDGLIAPSGNTFRLFPHGNVLEQEPNDGLAEATPGELPMAFNGIIEKEKDIDRFKFTATKDQVFEVHCYARRIRSALDPVMYILNAQGSAVVGNDDSAGPDSYFRFQCPADGEYYLQISDHLQRGAEDFVYRVEFTPVTPTLTLGIPRVARYSQYRQAVYVPRGNRFATLMSVSRGNFGGDVVFEGNDLPAGVTMHTGTVPASMSVYPIVFEAAADAPIAGKLVDFTAKSADPAQNVRGGYSNLADYVIAEPGQSLYSSATVNKLAFAVVDELPFHLEIVQPKVPIVRDGSMQLKIVAKRKEGFTAPITVEFPFQPPGIGAASSVVIPEGQTEVLYPITANSGAAVGKWPVYAIGQADVTGAAWVASQLAELEIAEPYLIFTLERAAVEQGQACDLFCKVERSREFEAPASVKLVGLPNKVTAPEISLTKEMEQFAFKVQTDATSPDGKHQNIFCEVIVTENGEPISHRLGSTELRIDKPLPKEEPKPSATPMPMPMEVAKVEEKPAKPLTRLEQLRLEAKQRAAAGGSE